MKDKLRIGTRVKIISTTKKRYLNKIGKIIERKNNWFGTGFDYLIDVAGEEKDIWQSRDDLEVINAIERARRINLKKLK